MANELKYPLDWNNLFYYKNGKLYNKIPRGRSVKANTEAGKIDSHGYRDVRVKGINYRVHRIIWTMLKGNIPEGKVIDHINSKKLDNRIENLQVVTTSFNNKRRDIGKGWYFRNGVYEAQKNFNSKKYHLGRYKTPCGAYMAFKTFFIGGKNGSV